MAYHFQSLYNRTTIFIGDVADLGSGTEFPIMLRLNIRNLVFSNYDACLSGCPSEFCWFQRSLFCVWSDCQIAFREYNCAAVTLKKGCTTQPLLLDPDASGLRVLLCPACLLPFLKLSTDHYVQCPGQCSGYREPVSLCFFIWEDSMNQASLIR